MFPSLYRYLAVLFSATIINAAVPSHQNVTQMREGLLGSLRSLGLSEYENITEVFLATPQGMEYLTQLATGEHFLIVVFRILYTGDADYRGGQRLAPPLQTNLTYRRIPSIPSHFSRLLGSFVDIEIGH